MKGVLWFVLAQLFSELPSSVGLLLHRASFTALSADSASKFDLCSAKILIRPRFSGGCLSVPSKGCLTSPCSMNLLNDILLGVKSQPKLRKIHNSLSPIVAVPLLISAVSATLWTICRRWVGMSKESTKFLLDIHQGDGIYASWFFRSLTASEVAGSESATQFSASTRQEFSSRHRTLFSSHSAC